MTPATRDPVLPKEDPFWEVNWPPNGWACRCVAIPNFQKEEVVRPPDAVDVDGKQVRPESDKGSRQHFSRLAARRSCS